MLPFTRNYGPMTVSRAMDELPMTSEDDCIICGKWPEKDRWALREMIDSLPLHEEPICDECLRNFWRRIVEQPDSRSKH